jgi:putative transposase
LFERKWEKESPSASKCASELFRILSNIFLISRGRLLSIRTTNVIEGLNKEFKRRTKPMEIVKR